MRPSLVRALAACPTSLVQRSLRGRVSSPHPAGTAVYFTSGVTRLFSGTGTAGRGAGEGEGNFSKDVADLNAEIEGFVGDLGDPDFDTAPSGPPRQAQDTSGNLVGNATTAQPGGTPADQLRTESISTKQRRPRLTQADHPSVTRIPGLDVGAGPEQADWSASFIDQDGQRTRSVLVLNGAACFVAGNLASTGEPRGDITKSVEAAAEEFNLSVTVCTSNREDELLDRLCEGGYDAIVYNPAGFRDAGPGGREGLGLLPTKAASDPDAVVQAEGSDGALRGRHLLRDGYFQGHGGGSSGWRAIEYGLAHAGCPVVTVSPRDRDGRTRQTREPGQLGRQGAISGFSGVVSYRLAMVAVASMLDDAHR